MVDKTSQGSQKERKSKNIKFANKFNILSLFAKNIYFQMAYS